MEAHFEPRLFWGSGAVKLWIARLDLPPSARQELRHGLSADEQARADGYRLPQRANAFIVRRGLLRVLLGRELGCSPSQLRFASTAFGKPVLASGEASFSVSSSRDYAVWGFSPALPVGVDIEWVDSEMPLTALMGDHFSRSEKARFKAINGSEERTAAFFRAWTGKEACAKSIGIGLSSALNHYPVLDGTTIDTTEGVMTVTSLPFPAGPKKAAYWVSLALAPPEK